MAAYAALASLMTIVDDIQNHDSPPISLDKKQVESLTEIVTSLQEFLEVYNSPFADDDEADPLEMRIADAAYVAEDVIETHIVDTIEQKKSINEETSSIGSENISCNSYIGSENSSIGSEKIICNSSIGSEYISCNSSIGSENSSIGSEKIICNSSIGSEKISCNSSISWFFSCFRAFEADHEVGRINFTKKSIGEEASTSCIADRDDEQINPNKFHHDLQEVIEQMDEIRKVAMETDTNQWRRNAVSSSGTTLTSSSSTTMVCSDDVLIGMLDKLIEGQPDRQVISITGMGGIGKTTLATNIYEHPLIKHHFHICAWATISQQYDTREILCEVLSQATNKKKEELSGRSEDELGLELYKYLFGRRFLIVMDDIWSIDAWEKMQLYLPNNENGSRILVTTRLSQLSSQLNNNDNSSLQMEFLGEVSSWDLFSKTVFGDGSCPPELMESGKKIADNCKGLPLSIVVVGGLLKKMDRTPECWELISNNLTSRVNLENDKHCLRLLKMSYNYLPTYLKPCFLYMGVFEEDDRIVVSTLKELWVSEGFLKAKNGESLETIAEGFLKDLVDRNLILVSLGSTGKIKYCKVHDLLRDLCLNEAHKNVFYHVIELGSHRGISSQLRVVVRRNTPENKVLEELSSMPHARSIICKYGNFPSCRTLTLLRILHAYARYDINYEDRSYMSFLASQNVNLRHLALGSSTKTSLSSLNHLWNLRHLASGSFFPAPFKFGKMTQIRHIKFPWGTRYLPDLRSDISDVVIMKNLETLQCVRNFKCSEEMVKRIPNIKKLEIHYDKHLEGDDPYCFSNIKLLSKLESLSFTSNIAGYKEAPHMKKLTFPNSLKSLSLSMSSDFEWEEMLWMCSDFELEEMLEKIGWLPLLQKLKLTSGCFGTGKWQVVEGQFPSLKFLELSACVGLKQWTVEESHVLPRLEKLYLYELKELEEIPRQIGDIPTLQRILVICCSDSAVKSAKEIVDEQVEMQGEELSFHVEVRLLSKNEALESLASPNFIVHA